MISLLKEALFFNASFYLERPEAHNFFLALQSYFLCTTCVFLKMSYKRIVISTLCTLFIINITQLPVVAYSLA